ncbi:sigma-70 family RNA polymerase sigma factor [Streptomyces sp. NPDC050636]|uniref:RNA polymerase sigma factor n=1 Tax=Streptomyces sp. NPDC050636 TaxID=3154510 RepID=UPI0034427115
MVTGSADEATLSFNGEQGKELLKNYATHIHQTACRIKKRFPTLAASADDLAQEAFLRTAEACRQGRLKPGMDSYPYLWQTARRLAIDAVRRSVEEPTDEDRLCGIQDQAGEPQNAEEATLAELREVVRPAIAVMRPTQRQRVLDLQSQGLEDDAIAAHLDVPKGQVAVQRNRGVAELQAMEDVRRHIRPRHVKEKPRGRATK